MAKDQPIANMHYGLRDKEVFHFLISGTSSLVPCKCKDEIEKNMLKEICAVTDLCNFITTRKV